MDQRQKDQLNLASPELADILNFNELSELLLLAQLVSKERIGEITASVDSNFSRNLKLLDAVQESKSTVAFDEFVRVLEITNNSKALQLLSNTRSKPETGTGRGILNKLAIRFGRSKSPAFPMGIKSGHLLETGARHEHQNCSFSPPMSPSSHQQPTREGAVGRVDREDNSAFAVRGEDSNKSIPALVKRSLSIGTPPTSGPARSFEKHSFLPTASHTSSTQTPARVSELKIGSLSLKSRNQEELGGEGEEEPVVVFHPYAVPSGNNQDSAAQSPHRCSILTSYASSNESMSSMESLNQMDSSFIVKSQSTMAVAHGVKMIVKLANAPKTNLNEVYKMTARPRGICLIVNNIDFIGDIFPTRTGSDIDAKRFDEVFTQLHFHVVMKRNLTAEEMKRTFKEVAKQCHKSHDALFVFILSHGNEQGIYGVDGLEVYLEEDVISCFDNRRCEVMQGKPKVLVIQACRGRNKDYGGGDGDVTDSIIASPENATIPDGFLPLSSQTLQSSQGANGGKKRKMAIQTDILLVFSCLHGYVSVRNELAGSWLGTSLTYWIMRMAFKKDFQKILNYVSNDINQRESSTGHIQAIDVQLRGWNKELYFNPGF